MTLHALIAEFVTKGLKNKAASTADYYEKKLECLKRHSETPLPEAVACGCGSPIRKDIGFGAFCVNASPYDHLRVTR